MNQYKLTNRVSGNTENLNQKQLENRIRKSSGNFAIIYSKELVIATPIQDKLNARKFCWLDIIFTACTTSVVLLLIYQYTI